MQGTLFRYTLVASLGGFLFGYDTAIINGALPFFREHCQLDSLMEGWAMSSAIIGCIIGAIAIGRPSDRYGRIYMLKVTAFLFPVIQKLFSGNSGIGYIFIVFALFTFASFFFFKKYIVETKGKTLEELENFTLKPDPINQNK